MFNNLRQGNLFYILNKGEMYSLKIGQVESVSNPVPKYPTYNPVQPFGQQTDMTIDLKVKVGEDILEFQKLPTTNEVFSYPNAIVSDKKEAILSEVETIMQTSQQIVDSKDYHQSIIDSCKEIRKQLNPQVAKEEMQEQKIGSLEQELKSIKGEFKSMKGDVSDIKELLLKMNSSNNKSK